MFLVTNLFYFIQRIALISLLIIDDSLANILNNEHNNISPNFIKLIPYN